MSYQNSSPRKIVKQASGEGTVRQIHYTITAVTHSVHSDGTASQKESKSKLSVYLLSEDASKDAIVAAANTMAENARLRRSRTRSRDPFTLTVDDLESLLEGEPDLFDITSPTEV